MKDVQDNETILSLKKKRHQWRIYDDHGLKYIEIKRGKWNGETWGSYPQIDW